MRKLDLKPCPFCGSVNLIVRTPSAKATDAPAKGGVFYPTVYCLECFCEMSGHDHDQSCLSAITKWNKRTGLSE